MSNTILNVASGNSDLPVIDLAQQLVLASSIAVYDMTSLEDISGLSADLQFDGVLAPTGATLTADAAGIIRTPVTERDSMTIVYCWYMAAATGQEILGFGNFTSGTAPISGLRLGRNTSGNASVAVGTGLASPATTATASAAFVAGWTVQAVRISPTLVARTTHGMSTVSATLTNRSKSNLPFTVNGATVGDITGGTTGTVGLLAFYDGYLDDVTTLGLMDVMADVMATRGITVP